MTAEPPPATPRIVVAGVGLITPLGQSAWETFAALLKGQRITDRVDRLEFDTEPLPLAQALGGVSIARHTATDPTVELAERAAREACTEAQRPLTGMPTWLGTSKGAVAAMSDLHGRVNDLGDKELPNRLIEAVTLGPHGYLTHHLTQRTGVEVHRHTVAACASSLTALHQAKCWLQHPKSKIQNPKSDTALVVTSEAALLPAFVHSYRRLGVLAPMTLDDYRQAPLDESRQGFVLSEVGAAVLLKRLSPGEPVPAGAIELVDTAIATEAGDLIRPSQSMEALGVVAQQLLGHRPIAVLHPHAPGTAEHDPTELRVLADVLRQRQHHFHEEHVSGVGPSAVYANKGALGHSLGSAGLVSFVLAYLCARTGKLPPMPWLQNPMPHSPLPISSTPTLSDPKGAHGIFAAGFGGHVAGAVIQRNT
ncbi:beta-ketoacyl synthase N-terminal-like domain-containing protein [Algisphaera agarilytica]|uniref:3-oxoacyl-(Acyl-carrier-protein) synthase n=1 Tax=Algisphaera agarilytica TaxID=1385975 RepID=A0A7X0H7F2_9BACT|nr:beta-ketoacyl synthase N-terminal-like domain-containing protein [Algisphaera agarilytica]MBB6430661.1 3-oxoacyl-(acyl-carrier-protein) synthase [Algisphaera agarilytica]